MAGPQFTTNGLNFMGGQPPPLVGGAQPPAPANPWGSGTINPTGNNPNQQNQAFMGFMQPKGQDGSPLAPVGGAPPTDPPKFGFFGGGAPQNPNPGVAPPPQSLAGQFGQLHPQVQNMLRSIPPHVMDQLSRSGLVHPGLMNHLRGGANGTDNGRQEDRGQEGGGMQPPQFGGGRVDNAWSAM